MRSTFFQTAFLERACAGKPRGGAEPGQLPVAAEIDGLCRDGIGGRGRPPCMGGVRPWCIQPAGL